MLNISFEKYLNHGNEQYESFLINAMINILVKTSNTGSYKDIEMRKSELVGNPQLLCPDSINEKTSCLNI